MENVITGSTENQVLQFTTINHRARKVLKLTVFEYCVFDSIYHLSNNPKYKGWCIASLDYIGDFIGCDEKTIRRARIKGINEGLLKIPENKTGVRDNRITTTQKWYDIAVLDKTWTKCPDDLDKMSGKEADVPDKMSNNNDNVNKDINKNNVAEKIESLFTYFSIPKKDRAIWRALNIGDQSYLLRQLMYAYGKRYTIKQPVKWIQRAIDKDFAYTDQAATENRDRAWRETKNSFKPGTEKKDMDVVKRDNDERNRQLAALAARQ